MTAAGFCHSEQMRGIFPQMRFKNLKLNHYRLLDCIARIETVVLKVF